jgi:hypothetical protein
MKSSILKNIRIGSNWIVQIYYCNMSKVICDICSYTKLKSHKGLVMHQAKNPTCLRIQWERQKPTAKTADCKPSASKEGKTSQHCAKREGHLGLEGEAQPCKKERLLAEVLLQKLAMIEPKQEEGLQNIWEHNSEESDASVEGMVKGGLPHSNHAEGLEFDPNTSSEEELEADSESASDTESEESGSDDGGVELH